MTALRYRIRSLSDQQFIALCVAAVLAWAGAAVAVSRPDSAFNFNIYRDVAEWVNRAGALPASEVVMPHGAAGRYADFPAVNLLVYRGVFAGPTWLDQPAFLAWQVLGYSVAIVLAVLFGHRVGLTTGHSRALAVLIASPLVSGVLMVLLEDKAWFFAAPLAAVVIAGRWGRAIAVGAVAGWLGAAVLTVALLLWDRERRRWDLGAALLGGAVAAAATVVAGRVSWDLIAHRGERESMSPFGLSVWRLLGDWYSPTMRLLAVAVLAAAVLIAYRVGRASFTGAYVALLAAALVVSTNTSWQRVVAIIVIGVAVWSTHVGRTRWLWVSAGWTTGWGLAVAAERAGLVSFAIQPEGAWAWVPIVAMNGVLFTVAIAPAPRVGRHTGSRPAAYISR
jgi:hypothetical protein